MLAGQTLQLFAAVRDAQGNALSGRTVTWSSSDDAIATVSTSGVVPAVAAGTAQIRAASEGKTSDATVTVTGSLATGRTLLTAIITCQWASAGDRRANCVGPPFATFASSEL